MTALELLVDLRRAGVALTANGERLAFDGPSGAMTPERREAVKTHKPELLALLAGDYLRAAMLLVAGEADPEEREALAFRFDERAAIAEIDGGLSRGEALRMAYRELARAIPPPSSFPVGHAGPSGGRGPVRESFCGPSRSRTTDTKGMSI